MADDAFSGLDSNEGSFAHATGATGFMITWRGSPNFWQGRNGNATLAIVDHIMESSIESADGWFHNTDSQVSAHYGVARDGRVYQWVKEEDTAWANGIVNHPQTAISWIADKVVNQGIDANYFTVSIEHEGYTGKAFSETQYQATLWLHRQIIARHGVQVDRQHLNGHFEIDSINRPNCPGSAFPWDRLMKDLAASAATVPAATAPTGADTSVDGIVVGAFGPGTVILQGAFVRAKPSFGVDGTVQRKLDKGTVLKFIAYTDSGPAYQNSTRWYQIATESGGGWIHSKQIG
jgi:N-acetyl-anhydromuramyl-L-alanine amidase AmpD